MSRQRLINCDFINDSKFFVDLSNKAKLLYLLMFVSADDKGFVGNTKEIIKSLEENESNYVGETIDLVKHNYEDGLYELITRGFVYEFKNKYNGATHLIRHWYYHNRYYSKGWTNYKQYLKLVKVVDGEYVYKGKEDTETPQETPQESSDSDEELDWDKMIQALESRDSE